MNQNNTLRSIITSTWVTVARSAALTATLQYASGNTFGATATAMTGLFAAMRAGMVR